MLRAHLAARGNEVIVPTPKLLKHWCGRLNRELFDGQLPMPRSIQPCTVKGWMACAIFEYGDRNGWDLQFVEMPMPRKHMLEVLAHELVHAAVYLLDKQSIVAATGHGAQFMTYKSLLEDHGLTLKDGFYG